MSELEDRLAELRPERATESPPVVGDSVGSRLRLILQSLVAQDAQIHVAMGLIADLLQPEVAPPAEGEQDPAQARCRHLEAKRVSTMGDGPSELLCPNCGRVDGQGNVIG